MASKRGKLLIPKGWYKDSRGRWRNEKSRFVSAPTVRIINLSNPRRKDPRDLRVPLGVVKRAKKLRDAFGEEVNATGREDLDVDQANVFFIPDDPKQRQRRWSISGFQRFMQKSSYLSKRRDTLAVSGKYVFGIRDVETNRLLEERETLFRGDI